MTNPYLNRRVVNTSDGTSTFYLPELGEHFHSINGAIQESEHVFIRSALNVHQKEKLTILEVGFGTGLNAWLTLLEMAASDRKAAYYAIELYPLTETEYAQLNFTEGRPDEDGALFRELHRCPWNEKVALTPGFSLMKIACDFTTFSLSSLPLFDLIFFDAFSPEKQSGMWTAAGFERLFQQCCQGAILVTYCAKGQVRRDLIQAGFQVERLPGPPGKREMLRAIKP
jgi:tRNA U34 5-methylaminomethyl-2-thiouridine-forming methyltransferase MnmC